MALMKVVYSSGTDGSGSSSSSSSSSGSSSSKKRMHSDALVLGKLAELLGRSAAARRLLHTADCAAMAAAALVRAALAAPLGARGGMDAADAHLWRAGIIALLHVLRCVCVGDTPGGVPPAVAAAGGVPGILATLARLAALPPASLEVRGFYANPLWILEHIATIFYSSPHIEEVDVEMALAWDREVAGAAGLLVDALRARVEQGTMQDVYALRLAAYVLCSADSHHARSAVARALVAGLPELGPCFARTIAGLSRAGGMEDVEEQTVLLIALDECLKEDGEPTSLAASCGPALAPPLLAIVGGGRKAADHLVADEGAELKWRARSLAASCLCSVAKAEMAGVLAPAPRSSSIAPAPGAAAAIVAGLRDALASADGADGADSADVEDSISALCAVVMFVGVTRGGVDDEAGSGGGGTGGRTESSFADALVCMGALTLLRTLLETAAAGREACIRVPMAAALGVLLYHTRATVAQQGGLGGRRQGGTAQLVWEAIAAAESNGVSIMSMIASVWPACAGDLATSESALMAVARVVAKEESGEQDIAVELLEQLAGWAEQQWVAAGSPCSSGGGGGGGVEVGGGSETGKAIGVWRAASVHNSAAAAAAPAGDGVRRAVAALEGLVRCASAAADPASHPHEMLSAACELARDVKITALTSLQALRNAAAGRQGQQQEQQQPRRQRQRSHQWQQPAQQRQQNHKQQQQQQLQEQQEQQQEEEQQQEQQRQQQQEQEQQKKNHATQCACTGCGSTASSSGARLRLCGGCRTARFCSSACLRRSWPHHQTPCQEQQVQRRAAHARRQQEQQQQEEQQQEEQQQEQQQQEQHQEQQQQEQNQEIRVREARAARACVGCGNTAQASGSPLSSCAGCRVARFCSYACYRTAWPAHKAYCLKERAQRRVRCSAGLVKME
jgi:hypothetical protein